MENFNLKMSNKLSFEEKIEIGVYPSKQDFSRAYMGNMNREQICKYFDISISTFKKLRNFYQLPPKKRVVDKSTYIQRVIKTKQTLNERYGEYDSPERRRFYDSVLYKAIKTNLAKYGDVNPMCLPDIQEKAKATNFERYGVGNAMQNKEVQSRASKTDLEKYGVKHHISSKIVRDKASKTILSKYGTLNVTGLPQIQEKIKRTNLERYGAEYGLQNPEIRLKGYTTMDNNGVNAVRASSQQVYINNLFEGQLNYLYGYYHIDSYVSKYNIGIEYSGGGHNLSVKIGKETAEHFEKKEKCRRKYFYNHKLPILEFISTIDKLPSDEILLNYLTSFVEMVSNGILYVCIDLDSNKIIEIK